MKTLVTLIFAFGIIGVHSHDWGWGECPRVDPEPNVSLDKVST